jgi:hypothetical protein
MLSAALSNSQEPVGQNPPPVPPFETFDPMHQKPLSYQDESIQATLIPGREHHSIRILRLFAKTQVTVPLPFEMGQVDSIHRVIANKLLVNGMVNGSGHEVVLLDLPTARQIDKFVCYRPSISPNADYIAFIKFYPTHFAEGTEDHYMVYDLSKKPEDNRPAGVSGDDWQNVGKGIYPIGIGNSPGDNLRKPEGASHESASGFFWNATGTQFLFADRVSLDNQISLVLVNVEQYGIFKIKTTQQNVDGLCSTLAEKTIRSCLLFVRKVEFHFPTEPALTVGFAVVNVNKIESLDFDSSRFVPAS